MSVCATKEPSTAIEFLERRLLLSGSNVLTYHNDNARTGADLTETQLTLQNVNSSDFGQLFSYAVDGYVYAQPLYVSGLPVAGKGTKNVVFVATEHDSLYAFDADSNAGASAQPLWHDSFINPAAGITTVPSTDTGNGDIVPEIGITGTPVIDAVTNTLYVISNTKQTDPSTQAVTYAQQLHAIDITSGTEKFGGPVAINFTTAGTGAGSQNGQIPFNALRENQRSALALNNGEVYVTWASHGDNDPYHGYIAAFDASTLALRSVLNVSPNGSRVGIWESGDGPAIDAFGNLFVTTGNGTFDNGGTDFGDSFLTVSDAGGQLAVVDSFTPFNQADLDGFDLDFGSGGVLLLPDQPGAITRLAIGSGKDGNLYLVDRDHLGGFGAQSNGNVQTLPVADAGDGVFSTPAYFNGNVYVNPEMGELKQIPVANGRLSAPSATTGAQFAFPGSTPSVSANGTSNGIVWEIEYGSNAALHAYDASNVANELYNSNQAGARDQIGLGTKFAVPTVADGHVFVGAANAVKVFGLRAPSQSTPPAAPTGLTATVLSGTQINLVWTQSSTNVTGFAIDRSIDGTSFTQIATAAAGVSSFSDLTAKVGTTYTYRVRAVNDAGSSAASDAASASTPAVPGLVGYWQFNEGNGVTTADATTNNDDGSLSGETTWIPGRVGPTAINFHGAGVRDSHVGIPDEPTLRFSAADDFTVGVWVRANALGSKWAGIVTKSSDVAPGYGFYIDETNHWAFATAKGQHVIQGPAADTNWHYLTLVQNGAAGTRQLYVDGALASSGFAEDGSGNGELWVGGSKVSIEEYFNGAVDDLRIYNRALSPSEVQSLSQVPATPLPGTGVISGQLFNDENANGHQDSSDGGVAGGTAFLDTNEDGKLSSNEPISVTDANGNYSFTGLSDGNYRVVQIPTSEQRLTTPSNGFYDVTISGGQPVTGLNFGQADIDAEPLPAQFGLKLLTTLPRTTISGTKATIRLRVTNTSGVKFTAPVTIVLFASPATNLDGQAISISTTFNKKISLKPNASQTFAINVTYPTIASAGDYHILASVTAQKSVGENQTVLASPNTIAISPRTADLGLSFTSKKGIAVKPGRATTALLKLLSLGNVRTTGVASIAIYASADGTLDDGDILLGSARPSITLSPKGSRNVSMRIVPPASLAAGSYQLIARVTPLTTPADANISNDTAVNSTRSSAG